MVIRNIIRMTPVLAGIGILAALGVFNAVTAQQFNTGPGNALVNESAYALDREDWSEGTALAEKALRSGDVLLENIPMAYNNLCIGYTGLRKFDAAITACNKAVELRPRQWSFYNNRANIYFYLGQFDKALAEYYKAMTFNGGSTVLMSNIGLTLQYRKNYGSRTATEKSS